MRLAWGQLDVAIKNSTGESEGWLEVDGGIDCVLPDIYLDIGCDV